MFCPRCGAPSEEGARFCAACGATLPGDEPRQKEERSGRERVASLIGRDRRARLITAATVAALIVAVIAFVALRPDDSEETVIPRDSYTRAADQICVQAKQQIAASERESLASGAGAQPGAFAQALVPIVLRWRTEFSSLVVPADRTEGAAALNAALREVTVEISALARVAQEGDQKQTVERAKQVDESTTRVETAVSELGLSRCARITLGAAPAASG